MMADADGVVLEVPDDTKLDVHVDAITEEMHVERSGKRWPCVEVAKRERQGTFFGIQDRRELQRHLSEMDHSGGYREG